MKGEQIERWFKKRHKRYGRIKRLKARSERHRANLNPECQPTYSRYAGWEY